MMSVINGIVRTFKVDSKSGLNLMSLLVGIISPEQIKSIGINMDLSQVQIAFYTSPVEELVKLNTSVTDSFTAMPGFYYISGLVRRNGVVLTGIAEGVIGKNKDLLLLLVETIDRLFHGTYGDYHMTLLTPDVPREYAIHVDNDSWRVFRATTAELMHDGTLTLVRYQDVTAIMRDKLLSFIRGNEPMEMAVMVPRGIKNIQHVDAFGVDEFAITSLHGTIAIVKITRDGTRFLMQEVSDIPPVIEGFIIKQCLGTLAGDRRIVTSVYYRTNMAAQFTLQLVS